MLRNIVFDVIELDRMDDDSLFALKEKKTNIRSILTEEKIKFV